MAFFKGDLNGRGSHDALAEEIATQGKKWTEEYWRWEDMQACKIGSLAKKIISFLTIFFFGQTYSDYFLR